MSQRNACSNNCFPAATTGSSILQSKVNAKFMIFIKFESRDKTCSKIEQTWFLLVNQVAKKQLSEWKKSSSSRPDVFCTKGFLKISQNSLESTGNGVSFYLRYRSRLFSCKFCKILRPPLCKTKVNGCFWNHVYLNSVEQFPEFQSDSFDNFCP